MRPKRQVSHYEISTAAPTASRAFLSFSTSSFGAFSLSVCGRFSTNFLAWKHEKSQHPHGKLDHYLQGLRHPTHLDQVHVWHDSLDFLDGLCLLCCVDLCQSYGKDSLLLWLLCFGGWFAASCCTTCRSSSSRSSYSNVGNIEACLIR